MSYIYGRTKLCAIAIISAISLYINDAKSDEKPTFNACSLISTRANATTMATLRDYKVPVPERYNLSPIDFRTSVNWKSFDKQGATFFWWLNTFTYLKPLLSTNPVSEADIDIAISFIKDWQNKNGVKETSEVPSAWNGHSVSWRATVLACLDQIRPGNEVVSDMIKSHGDFLADPHNYQGNWNHGLDQNIGLAALGCTSHNQQWIDIARKRTMENTETMVDWQGVSIEQSTQYHNYNWQQLHQADRLFKDCGSPLPQSFSSRLDKMPDFYAHATKPDGHIVELGDTYIQKAISIPGTVVEYAATQGKRGPIPSERFGVYQAGYIFGRTGWGTDRPMLDESYYSLRFGPGKNLHGHNDHMSLTYFALGGDILIDSNFSGYNNKAMLAYQRSPAAHNVVFSASDEKFLFNAATYLTQTTIRDDWQSYSFFDRPYAGTERRRNVLFVSKPLEAIVVVDSIKSPTPQPFQQAWHLSPSWEVKNIRGNSLTATNKSGKLQMFQMYNFDKLDVVEGQKTPLQGWAAPALFKEIPNPTILTSIKSDNATFLTVFVVDNEGRPIIVRQKPIRQNGISRNVFVSVGKNELSVDVLTDNSLRIAP